MSVPLPHAFPRRPRLPAGSYEDVDAVFHAVIRSFPGTTPFSTRSLGDLVWKSVVTESAGSRVRLFAAVVMPDHLHLVVSPGTVGLVEWIGRFKSITTRQAWGRGIRGKLWQPSFYDRQLREGEFDDTVAYVLNNPVAAGLVDSIEEWSWVACWV